MKRQNKLASYVEAVANQIKDDISVKVENHRWELQDQGDYLLLSFYINKGKTNKKDRAKIMVFMTDFASKSDDIENWMVVISKNGEVIDSVYSDI